MKVIKRKGFYYLGYSFKKNGKIVYREKYLGKDIPKDIEDIKQTFLRKCLQEDVLIKLKEIKKNFTKEWSRFPESIKKKILTDLSIDFTYNTNAIEGSTITKDETSELIKRRISPNKPMDDVHETLNHSEAFFATIESKHLSLKTILAWHLKVFRDTKQDIAGRWREYSVSVCNYRAPDWQDVPDLMKEMMHWYDKNNKLNPVELAARMHYKFERIHPFGDGNGRVGRLIIAHILKRFGYPILVIQYKKRRSYYHALTKTENDFLLYFIRRYLKDVQRWQQITT